MIQVLEYIIQNYTLFLVGAIIILLAIIGYYADKTNFGQNSKSTNEEKKQNKLNNLANNASSGDKHSDSEFQNENQLSDKSSDENRIVSISNEGVKQNNQSISSVELLNNSEESTIPENLQSDISVSAETDNKSTGEFDLINNITNDVQNVSANNVLTEKSNLQMNEEEFNMFSAEFDYILPKKNIINTDLLSDISDLELGKTQKIDLSDIPRFDNIELPKIKELATDDEDIWKI